MNWISEREKASVEKVREQLAKRLPQDNQDFDDDVFDPWELFPCIYGSYSSAFDDMALLVLRNIQLAQERRYDEQAPEELAHEIFREMLCRLNLCDYGTSPRVCFATGHFAEVLPALIERWAAWAQVQWEQAPA
jgi:FPC/CPF motif-containing protein YcgG